MMGLRALVAAFALGTAAHADAPAPQTTPAEMLPPPFTAEQIRDVWQPGFQVEMHTRAGQQESRLRMTVIAASAEGGTIRREVLGPDGAPEQPTQDVAAKWSELRDHALFSSAVATRERAECRSQLGTQAGWRYVVAQANGDTLAMCFADAAPGPPVEYETRRAGELISRTEHTHYGAKSAAGEKP
jgi:hypothetical protein